MATQPEMRFATLHTTAGLTALALGLGLDLLAIVVLLNMLRIDV